MNNNIDNKMLSEEEYLELRNNPQLQKNILEKYEEFKITNSDKKKVKYEDLNF